MEQRRRRKGALVVGVRFEPSRLAASCLAGAYERVVPVVHRRADAAIDAGRRGEGEPQRKGVAR